MTDYPYERRHYFRIDDKVHLKVRQLSEEEFQGLLHRNPGENDEAGLVTQLRTLTSQLGNTLLNIRKSHPEVALYLQLLDKKIEILARYQDGAGEAVTPNTKVNLGSGGMAFWDEHPLPVGAKLEIRMVLFPSHLRIAPLGRVVHAEPDANASSDCPIRMGVEFVHIGEAEQEGLARHLIELQSAQLRRQRGR